MYVRGKYLNHNHTTWDVAEIRNSYSADSTIIFLVDDSSSNLPSLVFPAYKNREACKC